jgi:hypothetical protein
MLKLEKSNFWVAPQISIPPFEICNIGTWRFFARVSGNIMDPMLWILNDGVYLNNLGTHDNFSSGIACNPSG